MIIKLIYILYLIHTQTNGVSVEIAVEVIAGLTTQFNLDGAYLLMLPEQEDNVWWIQMGRELIKRNIPTAVMNYEETIAIETDLFWFPICVIYSQGLDATPALKEFSTNSKADIPLWLLFLDENQSVDNFLEDIHIPFNCRFVAAQLQEDRMYLTEVYRVTPRHMLNTLQLGVWTDGYLKMYKNNLYEGREDLQGLTMRAVTVNSLPYSTMSEENGTLTVTGTISRLWKLLESKLNFTTVYLPSDDDFAGFKARDGFWDGPIGRLQRQEADVAVAAITMTTYRATVVEFSSPIFITSYRAFIKRPDFLEVSWSNFWAPFHVSLWMTISIIIFSVSVIVEACHWLSQRFGDGFFETQKQPFFVDSLFYVFGAFCSQGQDMTYRCMSVRTGFLVAHLTAVTLMAAYSAGLISSLTIETLNLPFSNYEEMLEDGTYMAGVVNRSSGIGLFKFSRDHVIKEIYSNLMEPDPENFPNSTLEGLKRVCSIKFAFVAQISRVEAISDQVPCQVVDLPETSMDVNLAIAFSKGNPYRGIINYNLQAMKSGGILQKLEPEAPSEHNLGVKSELQSLNLSDTAPLLIVWCVSIMVGVSLLLLERKARYLLARKIYKPEQSGFQVA